MSSLVVISRLSCESDPSSTGLIRGHRYGNILDLGFSNDSDGISFGRPPRPEATPYDNAGWMQDKFLYIAQSESGAALGALEAAETLVEDTYMRGNIDFTGIKLSIYLRADAYEAYVDYIEKFPTDFQNVNKWDGRMKIRIPSRPFSFPMPRGSSKPWDTGTRVTGRLRMIRRFDFDEIEVEALGRETTGGSPAAGGSHIRGKLLLRIPRQGMFRLMRGPLSSSRG